MSETTIRSVAPATLPAPLPPLPLPETEQLPVPAAGDVVEQPRTYILIGNHQQLALAPPSFAKGLHGHMPGGDEWTTASLTRAQAQALSRQGVAVTENQTLRHPPLIPSKTDKTHKNGSDSSFVPFSFRAVHEADQLAALGPEWSGKGGLFIDLDTGGVRHPDIAKDPLYFDDTFTDAPADTPVDHEIHGECTLSLGVASGDPKNGGVRGTAPDADWAAAAVLDKRGEGNNAQVLKGIEDAVKWAQEHPHSFVVVNMSLGEAPKDPANDPIVRAIQEATEKYGILFAVSAGNSGPSKGSIETPGIAPDALTVGAMDHAGTMTPTDDQVAWFSSRDKPDGAKPSLVADGVNVRCAVPGGYSNMDGTSMATPIAGGGALSLGQGLLAMYERGDLLVDPRDLVRAGEFQRILMEATFDNPKVPSNVEGSGDLRLMKAHDLFVLRYSAKDQQGPPPYFPGPTPPALHRLPYALPF